MAEAASLKRLRSLDMKSLHLVFILSLKIPTLFLAPYGVSMARLPPHVRQQTLIMDPHGTVKSAMSARGRQKVSILGEKIPNGFRLFGT